MKQYFYLSLFAAFICVLCGCSSFEVTLSLDDAYAEMAIEYHDQEYMEKKPLKIPDGVNEKRFNKLPFLIGFKDADPAKGKRPSKNQFSTKEWEALKREFEAVIDSSRRFPLATVVEGRGDADLRLKHRKGLVNVKELDPSELPEVPYIINVVAHLESGESTVNRERTVTNEIIAECRPVHAENNAPIKWFPSFVVKSTSKIFQTTNKMGNVTGGFRLYTVEQREQLHMNMFRGALVQFINHIYECFPAGGKVSDIDEDGYVTLQASRATGLQPNMQFVVYAIKKGDASMKRIALYNAVAETVGQEDSSTLKIWREADRSAAKKIIKMIEEDFAEAAEEYDFYACSDGLAQRPDFIKAPGAKK